MNDTRFARDLTDLLHEIAGDGAPDSLRYRLGAITEQAPLDRGRSWFARPLQLAAVAVVLVAAVVVGWAIGPQLVGPAPSASPAPSATPSGTVNPSASPEPSASPGPTGWTGLLWSDGVEPPSGTFISDLVPWQGGYVAVGESQSATDKGYFFTSADALHWSVVQEVGLAANQHLARVLQVGAGLLALTNQAPVECPGNASCPPPDVSPVLWSSTNGTAWTRIDSPSWRDAWASGAILKVVAGPRGVLAVGFPAYVTYSADGITWSALDLTSSFPHLIPEDVVAYAGGFVIVGRDGEHDHLSDAVVSSQPPPGVGRPAAWVSADGVTWSAAQVDGVAVAGGELRQVAAGAGGLFAIGVDSADAVAGAVAPSGWASADGSSWSQVTGDDWPPNIAPWWKIAGDGEHLVALGVASVAPDDFSLAAWASTDGVSWTRLAFAAPAGLPAGYCGAPGADQPWTCSLVTKAWVTPGGLVVRAAGELPQTFWVGVPRTGP
jgi:hypothetical protein